MDKGLIHWGVLIPTLPSFLVPNLFGFLHKSQIMSQLLILEGHNLQEHTKLTTTQTKIQFLFLTIFIGLVT